MQSNRVRIPFLVLLIAALLLPAALPEGAETAPLQQLADGRGVVATPSAQTDVTVQSQGAAPSPAPRPLGVQGKVDDVGVRGKTAPLRVHPAFGRLPDNTAGGSGLAAYWTFDEGAALTAFDVSPLANNGTLTNGPAWTATAAPLAFGSPYALDFDGVDDHVLVPEAPSLNFDGGLAFTLAAWVQTDRATPQQDGAAIIAKGSGGGGEQYVLDVYQGGFRFFVRDNFEYNYNIQAPGVFTGADGWTHVAAVFDAGLGIMDLYVDGQRQAYTAPPSSLLANTHPVSIGARQLASAGYDLAFDGRIDDVRVYNRALSPAEVAGLASGEQLLTAAGELSAGQIDSIALWRSADTAVNFQLTLTGSLDHGLIVHHTHGGEEVAVTPVVYGGETFWWPGTLYAGANSIWLQAQAGNAAPLDYTLTVHAVPDVGFGKSYTWSGVSKGTGASSQVVLDLLVSGTYHVSLQVDTGSATLAAIPGNGLARKAGETNGEWDMWFAKGRHGFQVDQDPRYVLVGWTVTVSLNTRRVYLPLAMQKMPQENTQ